VDAVSDNTESAAPATLGQTLAAERERQGMSRADVAQRLHMSAWQVEALEGGEYGRLPKGPFLRGFVRNYAKVLGLDAAPILAMLQGVMPSVPAPRIVVPTQNIRFDPMSERLASPYVRAAVYAVVAVAVGFSGMYYWMYMRPSLPGNAAKKTAAEAGGDVAGAAPKSGEKTSDKSDPTPILAQAAPAKSAASTPAPAPVAAPVPEPPSAEVKKANAAARESARTIEPPKPAVPGAPKGAERNLKFRFKGESWVEVRDGRGRLLLQRLNAAGSEAQVTGRPPFQIIVGNAPDVQMSMNDKAFDLEPHTRVAVARFTVE
jgi:cytoskeleton protein RodZ